MSEFETLKAKADFLLDSLTRISQKCIEGRLEKVDAELHLENLFRLQTNFEGLAEEILTFNAKQDKPPEKLWEKFFEKFEDTSFTIRKVCKKVLARYDVKAEINSANVSSSFKLPRMQLPDFSGDIANWQAFISQYDAIVHSRPYNNLEKLLMLRSVLKGEALQLVSGYDLVSTSYDAAYSALKNRYDNVRLLSSHYVSQLLHFSAGDKKKQYSKFLEVHRTATTGIKNLTTEDVTDYLLFELCYRNLPVTHQREFDRDQDPKKLPKLETLFSFVEVLARSEELRTISNTVEKPKSSKALVSVTPNESKSAKSYFKQCAFCKGAHPLFRCEEFKSKSLPEKKKVVGQVGACSKCLGFHKDACKSTFACRHCKNSSHHSFLCDRPLVEEASKPVSNPSVSLSCLSSSPQTVILGTLALSVVDDWGTHHEIRAILDPGSEINLITSSLAKKLGVRRTPVSTEIQGVAQNVTKSSYAVNLQLLSKLQPSVSYACNAVILQKICSDLPTSSVERDIPSHLQGIPLADPEFYIKRPIDLLLGMEAYADVISSKPPVVIKGFPTAFRTIFGYIVGGRIRSVDNETPRVSLLSNVEPSVESLLRRFWEVEEIHPKISNSDDEFCDAQFRETHQRAADGRYIVRMPFKLPLKSLSSNKENATVRLKHLENRFRKNPDLRKAYSEVLDDYVNQGHMTLVNESNAKYFLPHHCVMKDSTSTKVRVVFDASAKDEKGTSLNDILLCGPKLHNDLPQVITSFRFHEVALNADIRQMYRQIWLHPEDRQFQHILWRNSEDEPLREFVLNTVTFGVTSSPYLAQRTLQQLAMDEAQDLPHVVHAIKHHSFMDDFVTGADSVSAARQLQTDLAAVLKRGGFDLRKWTSSHPEALENVPDEFKEKPLQFKDGAQGVKILGLIWDQPSDTFRFQVSDFENSQVTKRTILSYIARIWDCLGFAAAVIIKAKVFLQRLWLEKVDWDDQLPRQLHKEWMEWVCDFPKLREVTIPRRISVKKGVVRLIGFADASEVAMAAVVYVHVTHEDGATATCSFLKSKTKLAPLKTQTIPRLELGAALLLSNLIASVRASVPKIESVILFSDSKIVLSWLRMEPHKLKIFVANRTIQIHELVPEASWNFTPGIDNPADLASRGISSSALLDNNLWWHGPTFLLQPRSNWPKFAPDYDNVPELKPSKVLVNVQHEDSYFIQIFSKYSSFSKLRRIMAYVLRFIKNVKEKQKAYRGPLTTDELNNALDVVVRLTQENDFGIDIKNLLMGKQISEKLRSLTPFLDNRQLLRAGGRLRRALSISEEAKHPLILGKNSHLSKLIVDYYHLQLLHAGPRTTKAAIQQRFWIFSIQQLLRKRIRLCQRCFRLSGKTQQPFMADLPFARVQESRAFAVCATDFAGPFTVKESTRRKCPVHSRAYICAFVCLSTKAVHLEFTTELTSASFLAAFQRFVARRGLPHEVISDQGRNYVGAARDLREAQDFLQQNTEFLVAKAAELGIRWSFQPPYGPNFNGLIESVVKSTKRLLIRTIGDQPLTIEEFNTVIIRIEAVLNSRPLVIHSTDPSEDGYLSPGHFLIGKGLLTPAEKPAEHISMRDRWARVQRISQHFWRQWSREYLHTLLQREKWTAVGPNVHVGQLVYMTGINLSPLQWPLARIVRLHPGEDSVVRVVTVRCAAGEFRRPVNKLLALPMDQ